MTPNEYEALARRGQKKIAFNSLSRAIDYYIDAKQFTPTQGGDDTLYHLLLAHSFIGGTDYPEWEAFLMENEK